MGEVGWSQLANPSSFLLQWFIGFKRKLLPDAEKNAIWPFPLFPK